MACTGGGRMEAELSHIDSLTEADQSAAIARIDSITAASGGGMARSVRMRLALLRAKACNKLLLPLNRDSLLMLDGYFTDHGTPNERMLAKYIIGCSYLDDNDAPRAVECFQKAISCADTLDNKNCDYNTLSRIYAQLGNLQRKQMLPIEAFEAARYSIKYALAANDSMYAVSVYEQTSLIYHQIGCYDSAMSISIKSAQWYKEHGYYKEAALAYLSPIFIMLEKGESKRAKPYIDFWEKNLGLSNLSKPFAVKKGDELFYYIKGLSYLYANRLDSAEYFFRKELRSTTDFNNRQAASRGLYLLYKRRGVNDSITKYAEMWNAATDSAYANMSTRHLQQMKAMYDYSRYQLESATAKEDAANARLLNVVVIISSAVVLLAILFGGRTYILRKRRLRLAEIARYERNIDELKKVQREYEILTENREARISSLLEEKSKEIERLQREKAEYESKYNTERQPVLADNPAVRNARALAMNYKSMTAADCARLKETFSDYMPLSQWEGQLSDSEYLVCLLVRAGFSPADIGILTQQSPSNISNIRKRLYLKMTGKDGSPKDFDKYIKSL